MDAATAPPLRIQVIQSRGVSSYAAQARVHNFLAHFQDRNSAVNGGDATISAQLQKVVDALHENHGARERLSKTIV
ncbi:hypothetical protein BKA93DRAFT_95799 [Sparassis latifolia]